MSEKYRLLLVKDALFSTIFVYIIIGIFSFLPISFKVFDHIGAAFADMEFTDLVYTEKHKNAGDFSIKISNDIVLINAADRGRAEIAKLLLKVNEDKPKVIGIDMIFEGNRSVFEDSLLSNAFSKCNAIVLASKFKYNEKTKIEELTNPCASLNQKNIGYANLKISDIGESVRTFVPKKTYQNQNYYPFAAEVVKHYNTDAYNYYINRKAHLEVINFQGNIKTIYNFNGNDIINNTYPKGIMKDKIVLIGYFGSDCNSNLVFEDIFYTPMNEKLVNRKIPDTYGVVIQANIINMILKKLYINALPNWILYILSFVILFLHNLIFLKHFVHQHLWYHFYAKMIQLVSIFLIILLSILAYKYLHLKIQTSYLIVPILLTVDLLYFYDTLIKYLHKYKQLKTYLFTGPAHH